MVKYNFSGLASFDNPLVGLVYDVNSATSGLFVYAFLCLVFIVSLWVMINRTQDTGKSLLSSLHIVVVLSLLLFFAGKLVSVVFVSEVFMYGCLVVEAIGLAGIYFLRMNKNE